MESILLPPWLHYGTPFPVIDLLSKQVDACAQEVSGREEENNTQRAEGGKHGVHPVSSLDVAPQDPDNVGKVTSTQQGESCLLRWIVVWSENGFNQ